ncbi:hypothetical protein IMY05_013G0116600 [Salix suchowensis]|nr:hypothetical protein IMY05_013G0116600 [Salix suchowensis]
MGDFEKQVKERAKELKVLFKKGVKIVEKISCGCNWLFLSCLEHYRACFFLNCFLSWC